MSDAFPLAGRTSLPPQMAGLAQPSPRACSTDAQLSDLARFWLQMHDGFRRETDLMLSSAADLRAETIDTRAFHDQTLPVLAGFLQHLDGHHRIESGHYFPRFRRLDDRLQSALDMLDRDHDAVHVHLEALVETGDTLHQAIRHNAPDARDRALRLADTLDAARTPLLRHLEDEEDIVIPVMRKAGLA